MSSPDYEIKWSTKSQTLKHTATLSDGGNRNPHQACTVVWPHGQQSTSESHVLHAAEVRATSCRPANERYKDSLRVILKLCNIDPTSWRQLALDLLLGLPGVLQVEDNRISVLQAKSSPQEDTNRRHQRSSCLSVTMCCSCWTSITLIWSLN